jgi:hypothetical protein
MNFRELLLLGLVGWTAIGVVGTAVSLKQGEKTKALRGAAWIVVVWSVYLGVLIGVSLLQKRHIVAMGEEQCYDEMCFTVMRADELPGFPAHEARRLIRVSVRVSNRGHKAESEGLIRAYLEDARGRLWGESPGLSGVRLTTRVAAGSSIVSEPVFDVASDATGLGLVFTHGQRQPGVLVIGGSDSLLHRRTVVPLGR